MASDREIAQWERIADAMIAEIRRSSKAALRAKAEGDEATRQAHSALAQAATHRFMRHLNKRPHGATLPKIPNCEK